MRNRPNLSFHFRILFCLFYLFLPLIKFNLNKFSGNGSGFDIRTKGNYKGFFGARSSHKTVGTGLLAGQQC